MPLFKYPSPAKCFKTHRRPLFLHQTANTYMLPFLWKGTDFQGCVYGFGHQNAWPFNVRDRVLFTSMFWPTARLTMLRAEGGLSKGRAWEEESAKWFLSPLTFISHCGPTWTRVLSWKKYPGQSWVFQLLLLQCDSTGEIFLGLPLHTINAIHGRRAQRHLEPSYKSL